MTIENQEHPCAGCNAMAYPRPDGSWHCSACWIDILEAAVEAGGESPNTKLDTQPATDGPVCKCGEGVLTPTASDMGRASPETVFALRGVKEMVCSTSSETFTVPLRRALHAWWAVGARSRLADIEPSSNPERLDATPGKDVAQLCLEGVNDILQLPQGADISDVLAILDEYGLTLPDDSV